MKQNKRKQLEALYAQLPTIACKRRCQESCGPIVGTKEEHRLLVKRAHKEPGVDNRGSCVYLGHGGTCTVYAQRPLICRLFGLVPAMTCPFGCQPSRWLTDDEALEIMGKAMAIGGRDLAWERLLAQQMAEVLGIDPDRMTALGLAPKHAYAAGKRGRR